MPDPGLDMSFVGIASDIIKILDIDACYKYLGKHLSLRVDRHAQLEFKCRNSPSVGAFHEHRTVILNHMIL